MFSIIGNSLKHRRNYSKGIRGIHFNSNLFFDPFNFYKGVERKNEIETETEPKIILAKDIIYNSLLKNNVEHAFIFSGGSIMPVIDKLYNSSIKYTVNSHEQNCGHAATGYAKTSNKTGVVMVTSGPGITNMITPMLDATNDSTPLVVISGQVSLEAVGTNAFQEAPAVELSKHVTKWSYQVKSVQELDMILNKAFKIANQGKKGAVHIDIPKCISSGNIELETYKFLKVSTKKKENKISRKIREEAFLNSSPQPSPQF